MTNFDVNMNSTNAQPVVPKEQLTYRGWLNLESLLRDNRSHAPIQVRNKCLDLSRIYIAGSI